MSGPARLPSLSLLALALLALALLALLPLAALADPVHVRMKTDRGTLVLELYPDKAPATVENFLSYVRRYYYDGLLFHRVIDGFVIQSGGYTYDFTRKETADPVVDESANGLKNLRGTVAMARHSDPDSATSQFYINLADNPTLDPSDGKAGYTVFGRVVDGFDVAETIGAVPVRRLDRFTHLPVEAVQILSVREIEKP